MKKRPNRATFHARLNAMINTLRQDITGGKWKIGEYLPSESALAEQYHLSKNSVRKGLESLVQEGLIVKQPRKGNMVVNLSDEKTVIKFGYYSSLVYEAQIIQLIEEFHRSYPHVLVQPIPLNPEHYYQYAKNLIDTGVIDVFTINYGHFREFVEQDAEHVFEPLRVSADVYSFASDPFIIDGALYVQPFILSPVVLCYNVKHFRELDLPEPDSSWTWNKLVHVALELAKRDPQRYGFYFHPLSVNRWPIFLLQSGGQLGSTDNGSTICDSPLMEGLELCRTLIQRNEIFPTYLSDNEVDAEALFLEEKVSMIMTTYFNLNHLQSAQFPFDLSALPYYKKPATLLLIIGLAINRHSKRKAVAQLLVDFLLSRQAQMKIRRETYSIPSLKPVAESTEDEVPGMYRPSRFSLYREIIPTFRLHSDLNIKYQSLTLMNQELKRYWSQIEDNEEFCKRIKGLL
ncbi:MAG: extracellular solute-binding protein [Hydrogenibacillus sp.]|nr:extracellular solute-binding protein [Hydrogenibacillus sp.]